jgi:hypothetical protein
VAGENQPVLRSSQRCESERQTSYRRGHVPHEPIVSSGRNEGLSFFFAIVLG